MTLFRFSAVGVGNVYLKEAQAKRFLQMGDDFYNPSLITIDLPQEFRDLSRELLVNVMDYGGNPLDVLLLKYIRHTIEEARN